MTKAGMKVESHRVDVRGEPPYPVCSCGWRLRPVFKRRAAAWAAAWEHRESVYGCHRRRDGKNLQAARQP